MEIVDRRISPNQPQLRDIPGGGVFQLDGRTLMRISGGNHAAFTSVELATGNTYVFVPTAEVIPCPTAKVIIE